MKCPTCGRPARIIAEIDMPDGSARIRRLCTIPTRMAHSDVEFDTVELPAAVLSHVGKAVVSSACDRARRGFERRAASWNRRQTVRRLIGSVPIPTLAEKLGVSVERVRQLASEPC